MAIKKIILFFIIISLLFSMIFVPFDLNNKSETIDDFNGTIQFGDKPLKGSYSLSYNSKTRTRQNDNWIIIDLEEIINDEKIISRSITIKSGGELIIKNSTIQIDSSSGPIKIIIEDKGAIQIINSNITSFNTTTDKGYGIIVYGSMVVNNSEINHICYETGVTQIESCGGIKYESKYSQGIEIYSDDVKILNSEIKFAKNTSVYINGANPIIEDCIFTNNIKSIYIQNSELDLSENHIFSNFFGIEVHESTLTLSNNELYDNFRISIYGKNSSFILENTTIQSADSGFYFEDSKVIIRNCSFYFCAYLIVKESTIAIYNSITTNCAEGLYLLNVSAEIQNNLFESCMYGIWISGSKESLIENNSINYCLYSAIEVHNTPKLKINNNTISDSRNGILTYESDITITNNIITNSFYVGVVDYASKATIKDNFISGNEIGISIYESESNLENNVIVGNIVGITSYNSMAKIRNNIIANNSQWAINITDREPIISNNEFENDQYLANGVGKIRKMGVIEIFVKDLYGNTIEDTKISIINTNNTFKVSEFIGGSKRAYLPIYEIFNTGQKIEYNPYTATAIWGTDKFGYTSSSKMIHVSTWHKMNLTLGLPDLYLNSTDIQISNDKVKHGDTLDITVTIHYSGTQMSANGINVTVTANGGIIKRFPVSFNASSKAQSKTFVIPWTVVAFESGETDIRVTIDQANSLENLLLDYEDNNIASTEMEVEGKKLRSGAGLTITQFCGLVGIVVIILILIVIIIIMKIKAQRRIQHQEQLEFEEKKPKGPHGDMGRGEVKRKKQIKEPKHLGKPEKNGEDVDKKVKDKQEKPRRKKGGEITGGKITGGEKTGEKKTSGIKTNEEKPKKKSLKEKMVEDLNRDISPRIKW